MSRPRVPDWLRKSAYVVGCCALAFPIVIEAINMMRSARYTANNAVCRQNMHSVSAAELQYSADWDDTFAPAAHWAESAAPRIDRTITPRPFHCRDSKCENSYVFNIHLDRKNLKDLEDPAKIPMLYEGDAANVEAAGDGKTIPPAFRHNIDGSNLVYADGHLHLIRPVEFNALVWNTEPRAKRATSGR